MCLGNWREEGLAESHINYSKWDRSQSWGYMGQARELDFHPPAVRAGESFKQRQSCHICSEMFIVAGGGEWVERGETGRKVDVTHFNPPVRLHHH